MFVRNSNCWRNAVSATARSTSATAPVLRLRGLVGEDDDAVLADRPGLDEAERLRRGGVAEEPLALPEDGRKHHQPQLVDEVVVDQRLDEHRAAGDQNLAGYLLLEPYDFLGHITLEPRRVAPRKVLQRRRDDVLRHRVHLVGEADLVGHRRPRRRETLIGDAT